MFNLTNALKVIFFIVIFYPIVLVNDHGLSLVLGLIGTVLFFLLPKNFLQKHINILIVCAAAFQITSLFFVDVYNPLQFFVLSDAIIYNTMLLLCALFNNPDKKYFGFTLAQIIGITGIVMFSLMAVNFSTHTPKQIQPNFAYYVLFISFNFPAFILKVFVESFYIRILGNLSVSLSTGFGLMFNKPYADYYSRKLIGSL